MFLQLNREQDPYFFGSPQHIHPCHQRRRARQDLDDLLAPAMYLLQHLSNQPRTVTPKQPEGSDKDNFVVKVDVQQFTPEELSVKMVDNFMVVEGKHEEKQDEHGFVSRQFVRRYAIPDDVKQENITCNLSSDGVLVVSAPRMIEGPKENVRAVPINFTGQPSKSVADPDGDQKIPVEKDAPTPA